MYFNPIKSKLNHINDALKDELEFLDTLTDTDVKTRIEIDNIKDATNVVLAALNDPNIEVLTFENRVGKLNRFHARTCVIIEQLDSDMSVVHIVISGTELQYYKMFVDEVSPSIMPYYAVLTVGTKLEIALVEITETQDSAYREVCKAMVLDSIPKIVSFMCKPILH